MKLLDLELKNFKGITEFKLTCPAGQSVNIYGDNATGKTTIFDSLTWLLFGKNSEDKQDFGIKTIVDGKEMHKIEHSVEAMFEHDGKAFSLKKIYKEKWKKVKGHLNETFGGNTVQHFIGNGEDEPTPVPAKKYEAYIASIIDEQTFKLLTNPLYFNEKLKWQDRRKAIMALCGDVKDEEIISGNKEFKELPEILNGRTVEDAKEALKYSAAEVQKKIKDIPARIDECFHSIVETDKTGEELTAEIKSKEAEYESINRELLALDTGDNSKQLAEVGKINSQIFVEKNRIVEDYLSQRRQIQTKMDEQRTENSALVRERDGYTNRQTDIERETERCSKKREELVKRFTELSKKTFIADTKLETVCPYCGQELPAEKIATTKAKIAEEEKNFNNNKAELLKQINVDGQANNAVKRTLEVEFKDLDSKVQEVNKKISANEKELDAKSNLLRVMIEPTSNDKIKALQAQVDKLNAEINVTDNSSDGKRQDINNRLLNCKLELGNLRKSLTIIELNKNAQERIKELETNETVLNDQYNELQAKIFIINEFVKAKADYINRKVAQQFKLARFTMFKENISNDGIEECCEVNVDGVSYTDLNNAARINVGLDIIYTLSRYYGFNAFIVIDNAESVTQINENGNAQLIKLIVSSADKKLRIA